MSGLDTARRLFTELAKQTTDDPGVTRASYGEGECLAHAMITTEAERIGLEHRCDEIGNLYVTLPGKNRSAPCIMFGSHLDSVPHGGNFDGAAGVLAGLAVLETFQQVSIPPFDITLMAIRAEEMIWFPEHYIGSRAAFGLLPANCADHLKRSDTGMTLSDHMRSLGFDPELINRGHATLNSESIQCFIELHIEQGPVLVENDLPVGIVNAIRGNKRYRFCSIQGETTHAGGVPRRSRFDAVMAGADLVSRLERKWVSMEEAGEDLVLTVGQFSTDSKQHGITKVPGRIDFTLDFRSADYGTLMRFDEFLQEQVKDVCSQRSIDIKLGRATHAKEALMDQHLVSGLTEAAQQCGVPSMEIASGGGHDCAVFASQGIPSAMLFVRNRNGSHNPDESMDFEDFEKAFNVLFNWLERYLRLSK
ncbi:MAG: hydantoinase/carbamoylase family amidase [Granulosicoccus sp.]